MSPGATPGGSSDAARQRLQALTGVTVHGSDGKTVGRVRDIYLHDATGELAAITVMPRQLSARSVLIPASAIGALPEVPEDPVAPGADAPGADARTPEGPEAQLPNAADVDTTDAPGASEQGGDHVLHLLVDAATAKAGARPPLTLHATPEDLQEAATALHLKEGSARA